MLLCPGIDTYHSKGSAPADQSSEVVNFESKIEKARGVWSVKV